MARKKLVTKYDVFVNAAAAVIAIVIFAVLIVKTQNGSISTSGLSTFTEDPDKQKTIGTVFFVACGLYFAYINLKKVIEKPPKPSKEKKKEEAEDE